MLKTVVFLLIFSLVRAACPLQSYARGIFEGCVTAHIVADTIPKGAMIGKRKDDSFSKLMAGVVNDSAILYDTYVETAMMQDTPQMAITKKPVPKPDSTAIADVRKNKTADTTKAIAATAQIVPIVKKVQAPKKVPGGFINKLSERLTDSSLNQQYVVISADGKRDTVGVAIAHVRQVPEQQIALIDTVKKIEELKTAPVEKVKKQQIDTAKAVAAVPPHQEPIHKERVTSLVKPQADSVKHPKDSVRTEAATVKKSETNAGPVNSNCKVSGTDYDVDKLRVKMLAVDNDDDKLLAAKKIFRTRCFTTRQVRALSEVFATDEGRYKLFDTAYPFVSDYGNFSQLSELLTSPYYVNRFKAMLR